MSRRVPRRELLGLSVTAAALVAWAAIGNLAETGGTDYIVRFPQGRLIPGLAGLALSAVAGRALIRARAGATTVWRPVVLAVVAGVWAAFCLRVFSAATVGANIGGGLLMLVGPVVLVALLAAALGAARESA